jgi:hypothetical protein
MERRMTDPNFHKPTGYIEHRGAPYAVENIATQERGTFPTAHDVAMFMWGRDFEAYRVYRYGVLFPWQDGDLHAFERALEAE